MAKNYKKGKYIVKHPEKYIGTELPMCRSGWEFTFCSFLDNNPSVKKWGSECFAISYYDNTMHKTRKYFIDFYFEKTDGSKYVIEIKPLKETKPPRQSKNKAKKTMLYEATQWERNQCKWKSAIQWCKQRGFIFKIITEKELFG